MQPRIYVYKITFEEVPYYYYGMHQEKVFGEEYWGSPIRNKWAWEFYTPKKQILQLFSTRHEAHEIEKRLIRPFLNEKWCLNANVGGVLTLEQYKEIGKRNYELKLGIHGLTKEQRVENARKAGKRNYELKIGIYARTPEQMTEHGKKSAEVHKKNGTGCFDPNRELVKMGGAAAGRKNVESGHLQQISELKYICLETGFISNANGLLTFQKKNGIDTSKRRLLTPEEYREKTRREFTVVSPTGEVFTGDDIDQFCREHKLIKNSFVKLLDGKSGSHNGFHLPDTELKFYANFTIRIPEGEIVHETNISRFCRNYSREDRKITISGIHRLIRGKISSHKGFTLV